MKCVKNFLDIAKNNNFVKGKLLLKNNYYREGTKSYY